MRANQLFSHHLFFHRPPTDREFDSFAKDDFSCPEDANGGAPDQGFYQTSCTGQYFYNGLLTFQRLVGDFILNATGADTAYPVARNGARFVQFPTPEYEEEGFFADIAGYGPLLVTLGLLYPVASMVAYVTREKELRQKELMKMMSVTESDMYVYCAPGTKRSVVIMHIVDLRRTNWPVCAFESSLSTVAGRGL